MIKDSKYQTQTRSKRFYILTVEPLSNSLNNHRLSLIGVDFYELSQRIDKCAKLFIEVNNSIIDCTPAIKIYHRFGRLFANDLSDWIHANKLNVTPPRNPAKIIFELKIVGKTHKYILYPYQMNLVCKK